MTFNPYQNNENRFVGTGFGRPGFGRPGFGRPGFGRPGFGRPPFGRPGFGVRLAHLLVHYRFLVV